MSGSVHPLDGAGSVELARVVRSGLIESRHLGAAVVVDAEGTILESHGDTRATVFPRSSLKPMQAIAVLRAGVELDGERLVLSSASHAGTPAHVEIVERMLNEAGLAEDALQTPLSWPFDHAAARSASAPSRIAHNCSGKHAAFLAVTVQNGDRAADYLDQDSPVQRGVRDTVEDLLGARVDAVGVDGCGAPLFATTLERLAAGTSRALTTDPDGIRLAAAIRSSPWALDGEGRANTVAIERTGAVVKGGAEGVIVATASDGTTAAVKVLDGSVRATTLIGLSLLARTGAIDADAAASAVAQVTERVLGGAHEVGAIALSV